MREIELKPIKETSSDYDAIELAIIEFFKKEIYLPLLAALGLNKTVLKNSLDDLLSAIRSGQIWFYRGQFKGRFNAGISRELKRLGAKWDRRQGTFKIPLASLNPEVKNAMALAEEKFSKTVHWLDKKLEDVMTSDSLADKLKLDPLFDKQIYKLNLGIKESAKNISVMPELTEAARAKIAKEYTENMKLYIKDFTKLEIGKLRQNVQKEILSGSRYENMVQSIQRSYSVSQNKAKFLARQETSILMAKFKQARYEDIGSQKYRWKTVTGSPNHPVRPMHKMHDGKVFAWSSPPVVDSKGNRKNPGEDYGCRCTAVPIISFSEE